MAPTTNGSDRRFLIAARVTLVLVYLVIIAGSVVRSTGAGMGCPDWPKCFGHYVPPTHVSELQYEEGRHFKAGYFIIWQNALWKAKHDLVATREVNPDDWEKYTKHDYAVFNAAHTWTEYGNRLTGVLLGLSSIVLVALSIGRRRRDRAAMWASIAALVLISFEGWLGALVVESKLAPVKITAHMAMALVIVALVVWIVRRARDRAGIAMPAFTPATRWLLVGCLVLTAVQTVLGTQVREQVDLVAQALGEANRAKWIGELGLGYLIHRSFAWTLLVGNGIAVLRMLREGRGYAHVQRGAGMMGALLLASVGSGIVLQQFHMPAFGQPTHLLLAALLVGLQVSLLLQMRRRPVPAAPAGERTRGLAAVDAPAEPLAQKG